MLHIAKLAVGIRDLRHLAAVQAKRAETDPPLRHCTRNGPTRAAEVVAGGSLYWVVAGVLSVRQRILGIRPDLWDDQTPCTAFLLDPVLHPVSGRAMKPFQGWRYLDPADAPPDIAPQAEAEGADTLPPKMRRALEDLRLL